MTNPIYSTEQTAKNPFSNFDSNTGIFELKGKSIPENSLAFYKPIFEWIDSYCQKPLPKTVLNVRLDYFNTSSSKCIIDLFRKIEAIAKEGKGEAVINWYYDSDDDDMQEAGEDYQSLIKSTFNLVPYTKS